MKKKEISLVLCGDIFISNSLREFVGKADVKSVFGDVHELISSADYSIANLEYVLSDEATNSEKIGPVLRGPTTDAKFLKKVGFDLVGCANNHIRDCGSKGVLDTITACDDAGLLITGAGNCTSEAAEPKIVDVDGWQIGVFAVAEREFNGATEIDAGAHIFDPLLDLERVRALKKKCDFVVILYSGGIEYHPYPSPNLQRTCRSLVRHGADIVLCQHSHVIGCVEAYEGGQILYGQGNTLFGYRDDLPSWNVGLLVSLEISSDRIPKMEMKLIPIGCDKNSRLMILPGEQSKACLRELEQRSQKALDPLWVEQEWDRFCGEVLSRQLPMLLGWGRIFTKLNRLMNNALVSARYGRRQLLTTLNIIRCDAHRDVALKAIHRLIRRD